MAAQITINLNDEDEAVLNKITDEHNAQPENNTLTPSQILRENARSWIRSHRSRFEERSQQGMRSAYKLATPAEKSTIDTILDQYR